MDNSYVFFVIYDLSIEYIITYFLHRLIQLLELETQILISGVW